MKKFISVNGVDVIVGIIKKETEQYWMVDSGGKIFIKLLKSEWRYEMKPILKINRKIFVEWMYNDKGSLRDLASNVIDLIVSDGEYRRTIKEVWESCGYISKDMVLNPEVAKWNKDDEIESPSGDYDVEWVTE